VKLQEGYSTVNQIWWLLAYLEQEKEDRLRRNPKYDAYFAKRDAQRSTNFMVLCLVVLGCFILWGLIAYHLLIPLVVACTVTSVLIWAINRWS
jgi:hypothetical protein